MAQPAFPAASFRNALGSFATGVTIVTTHHDGADIGLTANSFNSVSLDPPMVLWSLAKSSLSLPAFKAASHFAVHVLAADQQPLSDLFATQGADKFSGQNLSRGPGNLPLLMDCAARFECRTAFQYEGGDHEILVGEVENFVDNQRSPLVFTGGQYAVAVDKPRETVDEPQPIRPNGSFGKDYLGFLLSVAHHQLRSQLRPKLEDLGITDDDYTVLMTLLVRDDRHEDELSGLMKYMGRGSPENMFVRLQAKRLITYDQNRSSVLLTRAGRRTAVEIIAMTKAIESDAETNLDYGERELLKRLLRRIIRNTDPGTYRFWRADHA